MRIVSWAASNGDRSENGDYIYGKRRLREIDRRIRYLTKRLDTAAGRSRAARRDDQIFRRDRWSAREDGAERSVAIVGVDETDAQRGRGWISPIAKALLRRRAATASGLRHRMEWRRSKSSKSATCRSIETA